jgi:hypothetical protein
LVGIHLGRKAAAPITPCVKTQRIFANNRAERNSSGFFRFQAVWGLEKSEKIGTAENALEFSHRLDPQRTFKIVPMNGL